MVRGDKPLLWAFMTGVMQPSFREIVVPSGVCCGTDQLFRCLIVSIHVSGNFSFVMSIDVVRVKSCDTQVHQCGLRSIN